MLVAPPLLVRSIIIPLLVMMIGGCAIRRDTVPLDPKPMLVHLPGIAGDMPLERSYMSALQVGGFDADVHLYDWTGRNWWFKALRAYEDNRQAARELAEELTTFARANPNRPIFLSSDSGGAGPAVWALEALPADVMVEAVVLICPALSPDYDLSRALMRVRGQMLAFHSPRDGFVLGWGTSTWGTIDRKHVAAAGYGGFMLPRDARDAAQYRKLKSVAYDPAWWGRYNHPGDHTGAMGVRFASGYIAPLLTQMALEAQSISLSETPSP
ncbi:MAG TPA: hypothetical protein VGN72_19160 [Tepidisphaeraceae bacterium]|jgi:hypothetical protein|nr:hypothetical protein [Tepidisphaeraceae bacterium]